MNVEGAEVERQLGRSIMPRFHAAWSLGSITGAGVGIPMAALQMPLPVDFGVLGGLALVLVLRATRKFLPAVEQQASGGWREARAKRLAGAADAGHRAHGAHLHRGRGLGQRLALPGPDRRLRRRHWMGVAGYAVFVVAMTVGRVSGPVVLTASVARRSSGRPPARRQAGILLVVFGGHPVLVGLGIVIWGLGGRTGIPGRDQRRRRRRRPFRGPGLGRVHHRLRRLPGRTRRCWVPWPTGSAPSRPCSRSRPDGPRRTHRLRRTAAHSGARRCVRSGIDPGPGCL